MAYPKATLFGFSLALIAFNMYVIIMAALRATHPKENINETVYEYYIAQEIETNTGGMMVAVERECWDDISKLSLIELTNLLLYVANYVDLRKYRKNKRVPKKPPLKKDKFVGYPHVATKKLLDEAKANKRRKAREKLAKKAA